MISYLSLDHGFDNGDEGGEVSSVIIRFSSFLVYMSEAMIECTS